MVKKSDVYICGRQGLSQHRYGVLLGSNIVNSFWPAVKNWVSDGLTWLQKDELFLDPRLSALIHYLLDILLLVAKHLDR